MTNTFEATQRIVQMPRCARVRLPVVAVPARYIVTLAPCVIVWFAAELLKMLIASPIAKMPEGTVTPPVVIEMCLPASKRTSVYAAVWGFWIMSRTLPMVSVIAADVVIAPEVLIAVEPAMVPLVMAEPETLPAVEMVASLVSTMAALALMSASAMAAPLLAAVILPCASTVILDLV